MTDIDLLYYVCIPSFSLLSGTLFGLLLSLERRLSRLRMSEDLDLIRARLDHLERNRERIDRLREDIAHLLSVSSPRGHLSLLERVHDEPSVPLPLYEEEEPSFLAGVSVFPPSILPPVLEYASE